MFWIKSGERNTNVFHRLASKRKYHNSIWAIKDEVGNIHNSNKDLEKEALRYFRNQFKEVEGDNMAEKLEMVNKEGVSLIDAPISDEDLLQILNKMAKDKSPRPSG